MKKRKFVLPSMAIILFFIIGFMVRKTSEGILFDNLILDFIHKSNSDLLFSIMKFISFIGSSHFLLPVMLICITYTIFKKNYYISKLFLGSTLGSYVMNAFFKFIFQRGRPVEYFLVDQGGFSYPSGHSMVTMTFYMTLAYIISREIDKESHKKWIQFAAYTIIILMGISRLYLGVHWPTDVIGGYLIGYVYYKVSIAFVRE